MTQEFRPILYVPKGPSGWVSWCGGPLEMQRFMLTYDPLIDFVNSGAKIPMDQSEIAEDDNGNENFSLLHPILHEFAMECISRWGYAPWTGGAAHLDVIWVKGSVRIIGSEFGEIIEFEGSFQDWL